jgi:lipoate-protein ligase A
MKSHAWYLYDCGPRTPYLNMAMDEVMLREWPGEPVLLRLYAWEPPGLSLGYFQAYEAMSKHPVIRDCGAVITRRITGGEAILHREDLTFSLVGREGEFPFNGSLESSYHRIHLAMAGGFESLGVSARLRDPEAESRQQGMSPAGRCFYQVTRYDLVAGTGKLIGSAQRRTGGKVLHHGSIPLNPNPMTPEASDLSTLAGRPVTYREAAAAVKRGFEEYLGITFTPWQPDDRYREAYRKLAKERYGSSEWIQRR